MSTVNTNAVKFDLNRYLSDDANLKGAFRSEHCREAGYRQVRSIRCADGLTLSVQASATHYSTPRDAVGPWTHVEVGFPSARVEELLEYADNPDAPTDTVYGWVPVDVVEAVVEKHGGYLWPNE